MHRNRTTTTPRLAKPAERRRSLDQPSRVYRAAPRDMAANRGLWRATPEGGTPPLSSTSAGAPGRTRTCDPLLRRQPLYPTELQGHKGAADLRLSAEVLGACPRPHSLKRRRPRRPRPRLGPQPADPEPDREEDAPRCRDPPSSRPHRPMTIGRSVVPGGGRRLGGASPWWSQGRRRPATPGPNRSPPRPRQTGGGRGPQRRARAAHRPVRARPAATPAAAAAAPAAAAAAGVTGRAGDGAG